MSAGRTWNRSLRCALAVAGLWLTAFAAAGEETSPAATDEVSSEIDPTAWGIRWRNGTWIERNDGLYRLHLGGRLLADAAVLSADQGLLNAYRPGETRSAAKIRQGRLLTQGILWRRLLFKLEYDFAAEAWTDVFVGASGLGPLGTLAVGQMKVPFSLERGMSRLHMTFMERSIADALAPTVRQFGFTMTNTYLDDRIRWQAGIFRDTGDFASFSSSDDTDLSFRVTGLPVFGDDGTTLLEVGASYDHTWVNGGTNVRIRSRPESALENRLVDTNPIIGVSSVDRMDFEVAWVCGPVSVQAEYLHDFLGRDTGAGGDLDFWGGYVQASYFLTGENRSYDKRAGVFGRVIPANDFQPLEGHWGAFQVAARLSYLDLNDRDIIGDVESNVSLGVNWYPFPNLRIMLNYVHAHVANQGDENIGQARFQVDL